MGNEGTKEYKNAIVEGAGPVGLYATFKLFIGKSLVLIVWSRVACLPRQTPISDTPNPEGSGCYPSLNTESSKSNGVYPLYI